MLIGHLGDDVKIHHFEGGGSIGRFPLATNESYTKKDTGEKVTETEWHNIVVRNKAAELCLKYLSKGDRIYIEGKIKTRKWKTEDGNDRYTTEIVGNDMQMLGGGRKSDTDESFKPPVDTNSSSDKPREVSSSGGSTGGNTFIEDDIPF